MPKKKEECSNCFFGRETGTKSFDKPLCDCLRLPPQQAGDQGRPSPYPFPVVYAIDWCGEYKKKG